MVLESRLYIILFNLFILKYFEYFLDKLNCMDNFCFLIKGVKVDIDFFKNILIFLCEIFSCNLLFFIFLNFKIC